MGVRTLRVQVLTCLVIVVFSAWLGVTTTAQGRYQPVTEIGVISSEVDADIQTLMGLGGMPSLQVGIVVQDRLVWAKGYGDQPQLDTVYLIASITKTFTATAFLQLYEQGFIDLDADINTYLPFSVRNPNHPTSPITIRQLLSHTSGIARDYELLDAQLLVDNQAIAWINLNYAESHPLWPSIPSLDDIVNETNLANPVLWTTHAPGATFAYSNMGFLLLSFLLEEVTDQPLTAYTREHITTPLGMEDTGFLAAEFPGQLAIPHERINATTVGVMPFYESYYFGAGGLRSTVLDLAQYLIAHMNRGRCGAVQLLQPATVELMHQTVAGEYGLGWSNEAGDHGHSGSLYGFTSVMTYRDTPQGAYGVIGLTNRRGGLYPDAAFSSIVEEIYDRLFEEAERLFEQALAD
ncbi:MAG: serine hydrolase domain-containing protein, partial [Promethearchaeota archaeon]